MANPTISQALPRFLLPRLSWQQVPLHHNAIRALSMVPARYNGPSRPRDSPARKVTVRYDGSLRLGSTILENSAHHRAFHATARRARDHHFDTLKFVQRLKEEGFTETQAVAMMKVLSDVIEERLDRPHTLHQLLLTLIVSRTSLEPWSYEKIKLKQPTLRKLTLQSCAPNSSPPTPQNHLPREHHMSA